MSEARADLPPPTPASSAMGLAPQGDAVGALAQRIAGGNPPTPADLNQAQMLRQRPNIGGAPGGPPAQPSIRDQIKAKWIAAGATPEGAEGIVRAAEGESKLNPTAMGDYDPNGNPTSFGIYQDHKDRALRLADFAKSQNKSPSDPLVQTDNKILEVTRPGGDPTSYQHRDAFMKATDPEIARAAFSHFSERPATLAQMMMTPNGSFARERMAAFDRETDQLSKQDRAEYERLRSQPDPTAKERAELLTDARQRAARSREMYEDIAKHPPPEKPIDALQNFGSIGTMLALLMGGMGRHHMNGALMAAGAMMQAAQANNHEQFERQYKIWDHQSTTALNLSRLESDEVRSLLEDKRMSENERQARLHSFFEEHQMTWQAQQLRAQGLEHILTSETELERLRASAANQKLMTGQMLLQNWAQTHPHATDDEFNAQAAALGVVGGRASAGAGAVQFSKDAIDALVQQAMTVGPAGIMPSLPRSGPARAQFENAFAERLKQEPGGIEGGTAKVIMNQMRMAEAKSAATTAGRVTMNTELYSQEAAGAGQLLIDASKGFPRTDFTTFNQAIAAFETKTGDPRIIRFGTALNSLVNAYGKMTNPTGTGIHDADKESLRKIIDTSLSHGQIEAGVAQVLAEGKNVSTAAQHAQEEVLRRIVPGAASGPSDTVVPPGSTASTASSPSPPKPGDVMEGHRFKGGDPADPNNWEKVQ